MILKKYRELLYFPIVLSLLYTASRHNIAPLPLLYARYALLAGMTMLMCISYGMYWGWIPMKGVDYATIQQIPQEFFAYSTFIVNYSTIHHITHSFFMAILSFWALQESIARQYKKEKFRKILFLVLFFLATINVFFISAGRSGMAVYALLILLCAVQRLKLWQSALCLLLVCSLFTGIYYSSVNTAQRIDAAVRDIRHYHQGISRSSLGMRFDWWQNSLTLIRKAPLTGHGTGSFTTEQKKLIEGTAIKPSDNPHNEYLILGVQLGIPGIAAFLLLLTSLFRFSFSLPRERRYILQGITLAFAWGCLANSWLLDSHPSHFFIIATAILTSEKSQKKSLSTDLL